MAHDDDDRRRESVEYLRRQQKQQDFDEAQRVRTDTVFDSIRERDPGKGDRALGVPIAGANYSSSSRDEHATRTPTAGEQFREHSGSLLFYLRSSEALPERLRQEWIASVERLDIERTTDSLAIITKLWESYEGIQHLEPPASDFYHATRWVKQVPRIGKEIRWLVDILNHVLALHRR